MLEAAAMGSQAKWYAVIGAGSVTGMFCCRELLQRGGNVRAVCRDPSKWRADIEQLVAYFPRGKRGVLEFAAADVTQPKTLGPALAGCDAVIFTASGTAWSGPGGSYDVDYKARASATAPVGGASTAACAPGTPVNAGAPAALSDAPRAASPALPGG